MKEKKDRYKKICWRHGMHTWLNWKSAADMPGVGKTLRELAWREKYGINVAMIERGNHVINTPNVAR